MASLLDRINTFLSPPAKRSLSFAQVFGTGADLELGRVTEDTARRVLAVYACQSLISGTLATLPFDALRKLQPSGSEEVTPQPTWTRTPKPDNPNFTRVSYMSQVSLSLLQDGNAFIAVTPDVNRPAGLLVLNPKQVDIKDGDIGPVYVVTDTNQRTTLGTLTPLDCIHIPFLLPPGKSRGLNPIEAAEQAISLAKSAETQGSKFFSGGGLVTGVIEVPREAGELTEKQLEDLRDSFKRKREGPKGYSIGVLQGGAEFKPLGVNQQDAQYIETRKYELEEIARLYLVPPFMIGSQEPAGVAYASAVERAQHFIDYCLVHYAVRIEKGHDRLLAGPDTYTKFNFGALLRGDPKSRWETYQIQLGTKAKSIPEVRALEDLTPMPEGALLETPNNNGPKQVATPAMRDEPLVIQTPPVNFTLPPTEVHTGATTFQNFQGEMPTVEQIDLGPLTDSLTAMNARMVEELGRLRDGISAHDAELDQMRAGLRDAEEKAAVTREADRRALASTLDEQTKVLRALSVRKPPTIRKLVQRDANGKITGVIEEPV